MIKLAGLSGMVSGLIDGELSPDEFTRSDLMGEYRDTPLEKITADMLTPEARKKLDAQGGRGVFVTFSRTTRNIFA